jgi:hypothetical protein
MLRHTIRAVTSYSIRPMLRHTIRAVISYSIRPGTTNDQTHNQDRAEFQVSVLSYSIRPMLRHNQGSDFILNQANAQTHNQGSDFILNQARDH